MKKCILIALSLVCGIATIVGQSEVTKAKLSLTCASGTTDAVSIIEEPTATTAFDNDFDIRKQIYESPAAINFYAICAGWEGKQEASQVFEPNLNGLPFKFQSNTFDTEYTISFSNVSGHDLYFYDAKLDSATLITDGGTYVFEQAVGTTDATRFSIYKPEPTICHQYGNLIITGHKGEKVKVLDMEGEVAITEQTIDSDNKVIELSSLTSGEQYKVVLGEDTMIIRVQ